VRIILTRSLMQAVVAQGAIRRLTIWKHFGSTPDDIGSRMFLANKAAPLAINGLLMQDSGHQSLGTPTCSQSEAVAWSPACQVFFAYCRPMIQNGVLDCRRPMKSRYLPSVVRQLHLKQR
jgi:hypothetical protein